jgi:hypothetical protein
VRTFAHPDEPNPQLNIAGQLKIVDLGLSQVRDERLVDPLHVRRRPPHPARISRHVTRIRPTPHRRPRDRRQSRVFEALRSSPVRTAGTPCSVRPAAAAVRGG